MMRPSSPDAASPQSQIRRFALAQVIGAMRPPQSEAEKARAADAIWAAYDAMGGSQ